MVSGAAGVYVGTLLHDAGVETDLIVQPGQRVSVSGDPSLPAPPRWGGGSITVQARGSLGLSSVEITGAVGVSGGELSMAEMNLPIAVLVQSLFTATPGSMVRLSGMTLIATDGTLWPQLQPGTLVASKDGDGAFSLNPPVLSYMDWFRQVRFTQHECV